MPKNMKIIDLTCKIIKGIPGKNVSVCSIKKIKMPEKDYQGLIYDFYLSSMSGTYIDLPGHIKEFDNGLDASNYPLEKLFMVDTTVIRLHRQGLGREIRAEELEKTGISVKNQGLLINSGWDLGAGKPTQEIPFYGRDAIEWIVSKGINLFISDVYENHSDPRGIFVEFFKAGIACVCIPANLEKLSKSKIKVCAIPIRIPGAVQVPCRLLAIE